MGQASRQLEAIRVTTFDIRVTTFDIARSRDVFLSNHVGWITRAGCYRRRGMTIVKLSLIDILMPVIRPQYPNIKR